jgi:hypothetical protein
MSEDSSTPDASGDAGNAPDWQAKYAGMNRLAQERTAEAKTAKERAERAEAELAVYKAREAHALEEQNAQAEYERLRERFEDEYAPPTPLRHNEARDTRVKQGKDDGSYKYLSDSLPTSKSKERESKAWPF